MQAANTPSARQQEVVKKATKPFPLAPVRVFELQTIYYRVKSIDVVNQQFEANCYVEMLVKGAANDAAFAILDQNVMTNLHEDKDGRVWPVVPSVLWYIQEQLKIANAYAVEKVECKALKTKEGDVRCIIRVEGTFEEEMELQDYPCDFQDLHIVLEMQCADTGPFPVRFTDSSGADWSSAGIGPTPSFDAVTGGERKDFKTTCFLAIDAVAFNIRNSWRLVDPYAPDYNPRDIGVQRLKLHPFQRKGIVKCDLDKAGNPILDENNEPKGKPNYYPAFAVGVRLNRSPEFYLYNVSIPMGSFSLLAIFSGFALDHTAGSDRLGVGLTLILTAAAYKFAIATMVPSISYLTLLDKYVLQQAGIIVLITFEHAIFAFLAGPLKKLEANWDGEVIENLEHYFELLDKMAMFVILVIWVINQASTIAIWRSTLTGRKAKSTRLPFLEIAPDDGLL